MKVIDLSGEVIIENFNRDVHDVAHIEAPAHQIKDGMRIEQYPIEIFLVHAVLLDLTHKKSGQVIDDEDLEAAEERAGLALREGEAVLLHTTRSDAPNPRNYPHLSENGAQFLEFKCPSIVGTDAPSLDPYDDRVQPAHSVLLQAGILLLEGLCNLEKIDRPRFQLVALPFNLKGSASPVRAAAILQD